MSFTYKTRTRHSILQCPTHYTVCLPLSQIRYYMEYGACSVSCTYITYRAIRILHYIACCVNRYVSKERMPDHADDKHKISAKSRNPEVQQCWRVLLGLEGGVGGSTVLLNGVGTIFPVCRRRKRGDDADFWLGRLATHRSRLEFSECHPSKQSPQVAFTSPPLQTASEPLEQKRHKVGRQKKKTQKSVCPRAEVSQPAPGRDRLWLPPPACSGLGLKRLKQQKLKAVFPPLHPTDLLAEENCRQPARGAAEGELSASLIDIKAPGFSVNHRLHLEVLGEGEKREAFLRIS